MNREQAKALLPIIKAFSEGKTIQWLTGSGEWYDVVGKDTIDFEYLTDRKTKYRIKPESKYRPFKGAEECWSEMQKHQPFGWILDRYGEMYNIVKIRGKLYNNRLYLLQLHRSFGIHFYRWDSLQHFRGLASRISSPSRTSKTKQQ